MKFYTGVAKGLKLKVRKFWRLILTFVEVTGEKLVGGGGLFCLPILNRVNVDMEIVFKIIEIKSIQTNTALYLSKLKILS